MYVCVKTNLWKEKVQQINRHSGYVCVRVCTRMCVRVCDGNELVGDILCEKCPGGEMVRR